MPLMQPLDLRLHARQTEAFITKATEVLYGGAAGGGKSHLMRVAAIVWCAEIASLQVYLFRRLSDDLFKNHMAGSGSFLELLGPWMVAGLVKYNGSKNYLEFWNGSRIWLCHCQHEKDRLKYQGAEIHVLMIDELTHFTEVIYRFLRGRCRLGGLKIPAKYAGMFPRVLAGSNPGGIGHTFARRMFVKIAAPMTIVQQPSSEGGMTRQFIPARLEDNPTLTENDPDYVTRLSGLGSPALVKAMRDGDWDIVAGGALDDVWDQRLVLPQFRVPSRWRTDRTLDWGSAKPFSVGWWAEANGEEAVLPNGHLFCPPAGTLIRFYEWYGSREVGSNEGLKLGSIAVAQGIKEREASMRHRQIIAGEVFPGPADNAIGKVEDGDSKSVKDNMADEGVHWTESDKSPGSRINGLQLLRDRMTASAKGEGPGIFFTENCVAATSTLPILSRDPHNPEDVNSAEEDHAYDEIRYKVLSNAKRFATALKVRQPT